VWWNRLTRARALLIAGTVTVLVAGLAGGVVWIGSGSHGNQRPAAWGEPGGVALRSGQPLTTASASASASPSPSLPAGAAAHGGSGAKLRQVDGGASYYRKFSPSLPSDASFFPVGVWFESVTAQSDIDKDRDAGLNTYVQLTDSSKMNLIASAGMYAIQSDPTRAGKETVGWELPDETDMWAGPGDATWTGKYSGEGAVCDPAGSHCGYTVAKTIRGQYPADGRLRYANYGKGVTFWESNSEAAVFVNQFQDVLSADNYWFTDDNICIKSEGGSLFDPKLLQPGQDGNSPRLSDATCHRAANYGKTIDRLRSLVSPAGGKPVWAFVEVGHPGTETDEPSIQPRQLVAAVWSSLIHGARGIIYFNHSFGGPCKTQHALRDPCYTDIRAAVKQLDGRIAGLAPVLNAPFADGVVKGSAGVDAATKWYDGHFYVLAGANSTGAQTATFTMPCVGAASVTVLDENRTLPATKGSFTDQFADGNTVHLYRIDGGSSCGAY
jgi:hypothetical protein